MIVTVTVFVSVEPFPSSIVISKLSSFVSPALKYCTSAFDTVYSQLTTPAPSPSFPSVILAVNTPNAPTDAFPTLTVCPSLKSTSVNAISPLSLNTGSLASSTTSPDTTVDANSTTSFVPVIVTVTVFVSLVDDSLIEFVEDIRLLSSALTTYSKTIVSPSDK